MKRSIFKFALSILTLSILGKESMAQGLHFSQYYNAPLLWNPANTGLLPVNDYRVGANYRKQWVSVPVPFRTFSAYADFQALRNKNQTNWLGLGLSFWNDKAGNGELSLSRSEAFIAYHIQLGEYSMISAGASAAVVQRSVDFNKLIFDMQWNAKDLSFDRNRTNGETGYVAKSSYSDLSLGINYAFFPNENTYLKAGFGLAHLTQPKESFYGQDNQLGMRPSANLDLLLKLSSTLILNPSLYYTSQKSASQLVFGTLFEVNVTPPSDHSVQFIFGGFHRFMESAIGAIGIQYDQWRVMYSYDFTVSSLSPQIKGRGAYEIGIKYEALYGTFSQSRRTYNCPRF